MSADRYADLHHVGTGPKFYTPGTKRQPWRAPVDLIRLEIGDSVDVLLDDGRIVRTAVRGKVAEVSSHYSVWVYGIVGAYILHRVRRAGGWADLPGVTYAVGGAAWTPEGAARLAAAQAKRERKAAKRRGDK